MYYTPEILRPITGTENALFQTTFVGVVFILQRTVCT